MKKRIGKLKLIFSLLIYLLLCISGPLMARSKIKSIVFDVAHGQNINNSNTFSSLLPEDSVAGIEVNKLEITPETLRDKDALIIFSPINPFSAGEKQVILSFLRGGGSMLLIFDEERRMKLQDIGVNDFVAPLGISFTGDTPVRHNCGAIAEKSSICKGKRELPYSGGRSIVGGQVISWVNDDGNYIHCAWKKLPKGGKVILMSDGMAGLLLGKPDGIRFSGTGPSDSKYWGKDSKEFMKEILAFLIK
jgi:hypothetical protein